MNSTANAANVIDVVFLPSLVGPDFFSRKTVVVVDVLRATTTISVALSQGCQYVLPQGSIELARQSHQRLQNEPSTQGRALLGGERQGRIIPGFHHGNSPVEYSEMDLTDKIVILATTNGTVAMDSCRQAGRVLIGAMVNLAAVSQNAIHDREVVVLCSGTDGSITQEDVLFAGAFVQRIMELRTQAGIPKSQITDTASIALGHWQSVQAKIADNNTDSPDRQEKVLTKLFTNSRGGINLARIGHLPDIQFAAKIDSVPIVPQLNLESWQIHTVRQPSRIAEN